MRLSFYASQPHYWRHLRPIADALRARGAEVDIWSDNHQPWGPAVTDPTRRLVAPVVVVASYQDAQRWRDRACVYVEHGAGQTYRTDDLEEPERLRLGFAGGGGLDHCALFLCPSERVAGRWRDVYPAARIAVVGCAALDRYEISKISRSTARDFDRPAHISGADRTTESPPGLSVVAVTCHWRFDVIPEGRPALPLYLEAFADLHFAELGIFVVGHGHPRIQTEARRWWDTIGIPFEPDPDRILSEADLLIADNTSLMYEAAAVDLPVLVLNAPWYRRDVGHGLRFWSHVPGLECNDPADLGGMIRLALHDPSRASALRARAARAAYAVLDGHAADRAADAILTLEGAPMPEPASENARHRDEVIDRLHQLGADEEMVAAVRGADDDTIERLRRSNDQMLATEIANTRAAVEAHADAEYIEEVEDDREMTEEEKDAAAGELLAAAGDDEQVVAAVGADAELAARLFRLESEQADPSVYLLEALARTAGIDYQPPAPVEAEVPAPVEATPPAEAPEAPEPTGEAEPVAAVEEPTGEGEPPE